MELLRTLGALLECPTPESGHLQSLADHLEIGQVPEAAVHTDLFQFQLYPYASVYLGEEGMLGGDARDRIAGLWRVLELNPPPECDHLTMMLTFLAHLDERRESAPSRHRERWRHLHATFLHEHLLTWLPPWLARLRGLAPTFYVQWADLLEQTLREQNTVDPPTIDVPAFMQQTPGIADPRHEGLEAFLDSLLTPQRSGLLIVRDDLRRGARYLDLGVRLAERKFVLKGLLMQNAAGVLAWLAEEAETWAARHPKLPLAPPNIAQHWSARATVSSRLLADLAEERRG